jgi:hypothetical protein
MISFLFAGWHWIVTLTAFIVLIAFVHDEKGWLP